jgi:hypothetical protein
VRLTTQVGDAAVRRSVFDRIPGEGLWDAVLLADGNVGISVRHQRSASAFGTRLRSSKVVVTRLRS